MSCCCNEWRRVVMHYGHWQTSQYLLCKFLTTCQELHAEAGTVGFQCAAWILRIAAVNTAGLAGLHAEPTHMHTWQGNVLRDEAKLEKGGRGLWSGRESLLGSLKVSCSFFVAQASHAQDNSRNQSTCGRLCTSRLGNVATRSAPSSGR